jgi:CsoR family transcriptional regulator, copper-sensing transcriptional repressor
VTPTPSHNDTAALPRNDTAAAGTTHDHAAHDHSSHGYITAKDDYLKRLRRIEGQARGLQRMVEEEKYCIDILTQVSAMTKALQAVAMGLLEDHISHCVVNAAVAGGPEADAKIKEATDAIARLVRS